MNIKLKDEYINKLIYLPVENRDVIGKFIDARLYPYLYKKYPQFFELVKEEKVKKTKQTDDILINNTKHSGNSDIIGEDI